MLQFLALATLAASLPTSAVRSCAVPGAEMSSIGSLAFAPDGVLFAADPQGAQVFALQTRDTKEDAVEGLSAQFVDAEIADLVGMEPGDLLINDLAVHPLSGAAYLSVSRGRGPDALPLLVRVGEGVEVLALADLESTRAALPNAPVNGEGRAAFNRVQSITDMEFYEGRLFVAGLSNEEFASKLRSIPYPFEDVAAGASIEIYHGAHGAYETRAPVRTFAPYDIGGTQHLLAAYTCTPLVKIPLRAVLTEAGAKVRGTTVAELGPGNTPLDMVVYEKDGAEYVLIANSSRGMMKVTTAGIADMEGITARTSLAGLQYETIDYLSEVVQLAGIDNEYVMALIEPREGGGLHLETIELP